MNDDNSARDTRRGVLKTLGAMGLASAGMSTASASKGNDQRVFRLKRNHGWRAEIEVARDVDGVTVETTSSEFIVTVDTSELRRPSWSQQQKAHREMRKTRRQADEEVAAFYDRNVGTLATESVSLGTNKTLYDMTTGTKGSSGSGYVTVVSAGSNYNTSSDRATAAVLGTIGFGSVTHYSTIGVPFNVTGSGSRTATIAGIGNYKTQITTLGAGTANVNVEFRVKNNTTGTLQTTGVLDANGGVATWREWTNSFNRGIAVNLNAGHSYTAFIRLAATINVGTVGEACADAGPQDGDDYSPLQGAVLDRVSVTF